MTRCALVLLIVLAACGGDDELPPPKVQAPTPPAGDNDPSFDVQRLREWYLIGNDLTESQDEMLISVVAPTEVEFVDVWVADRPGVRLVDAGTDHRQIIDIADLGPGEYTVLLAADGSDTAFAAFSFTRTHPLYVLVSTDWDDPDNTDAQLDRQQKLHDEHPELELTHFVGPYVFTAPEVTDARRAELAQWVIDMRDNYGDEIGLHIHPYCNFVDTTSVACRTTPSFRYLDGDETGYSVHCDAYTREEFVVLLERADELFMANGLGKPTSFRAGGWTAGLETLQALADTGYIVDTSANNWARLEEWDGTAGATLYDWNRTHWASIDDTSQPYYPSASDILATDAPIVSVLEVPDNGILVDYVEGPEMVEIFDKNYPGGALDQPTVYQIGFHPPNFSDFFERKIDFALDHVEQFRASKDDGPVVFATLSDMAIVFPPPQ